MHTHTSTPVMVLPVVRLSPKDATSPDDPRLRKHARTVSAHRFSAFDTGIIALCAALNVSAGYLAGILKMPLYLDSIGTVLVTALCGWTYGVFVALAALVVLALTTAPTVAAYAGTAVLIPTTVWLLMKAGFLRTLRGTVLGGIVLGVVSAAASAPVTAFVYGGVTLSGSDAMTAVFRAFGLSVWKSVLLGGMVTDSVDKLITALACLMLIRALPPRLLSRLRRER